MSTPFYDLASLVVVPSGYKASKVYAQKPLTTDGQLTFSRASTATRVNSAGLIETVSSNVPRLDYLGSTCPKLQLEPSRTNAFPYSEDVASWIAPQDGVTITSNTTDTVSPDGTNNATKVTIVGGNKRSYEITNSTAGAGTLSIFVKSGTGSSIALFTSSGSLYCSFNLSTQVVTPTTGTGTITSYGNGWYRLTVSGTIGNNEVVQVIYGGAAGLTFYIWGAMIENGAYATSYVKTAGASSVTRLADACSKSAAFTASANWTIFAEFDYVNSKKVLDTTFTSSTGRFVGFYNWFGEFRVIYNTGGGAGAGRVVKNTNGKVKVILQNDGTDCFVFLNGVKLGGADTGGPLPITGTLANISFSFYAGTLYDTAKELDKFLIFNQKLTDAQCVELTAL